MSDLATRTAVELADALRRGELSSPLEGLPVGAQIVARYPEDHSALAFALLLARETGGCGPPPGFDGPGGLR